MGKSPGKWIKTLLLGKKSSKSKTSKGREKLGNEKEVWIAVTASEAVLAPNSPVASDLNLNTVATNDQRLEEIRKAANFPVEVGTLQPGDKDSDILEFTEVDSPEDPERKRQELAATKVQAAFKGYLAHRAFRALKGIIRLQALVRGHLVRRQAVSTLRCMVGIIKLQALARGRNVRHSNADLQVQKKCILVTPPENKLLDHVEAKVSVKASNLASAFVHKVLVSSSSSMPLHLQYDSTEPNSVLSWLERWSLFLLPKQIFHPKKVSDSKSKKLLCGRQIIPDKVKKDIRRNSPLHIENASTKSASEIEKSRRNLRKVSNHPADTLQDNPQNELEKIKRNLRKVHDPDNGTEGTTHPGQGKLFTSLAQNSVEESTGGSSEKTKEDTIISKQPDVQVTLEPEAADQKVGLQDDQMDTESQPSENCRKDETSCIINGELHTREGLTINESQKPTLKASPSSVKHEHAENGFLGGSKLPSYMAATESAKAKLRAQGSPGSGQDGFEKDNLNGQYSLPASTERKTSSASPRAQRPVKTSSKGGNRSDRSQISARDGKAKGVKEEWRI
ncbi:hypothetical protein NMG60_11009593 [Bertholletia excelsa]